MRHFWLALLAVAAIRSIATESLAAQVVAAIPKGTLRGVVRDSILGVALPYALISLVRAQRRTFATADGDFVLEGLEPGSDQIRIQQIGYAPVQIPITLVRPDGVAPDRVELRIGRAIYRLPDLVVAADGNGWKSYRQPANCRAPSRTALGARAEAVIGQAVTNADRIAAQEESHPFRAVFDRVRTGFDSAGRTLGSTSDTTVINSKGGALYRKGRVVSRPRSSDAPVIFYFTAADLSRKEFQDAHCLWYVGTDTVKGRETHRLEFSPAPDVRTVDWTGAVQVDAETFLLVRSEARLVNLLPKAAVLRSVGCVVGYRATELTVMHVESAECRTEQAVPELPVVVESSRLLSTSFYIERPPEVHINESRAGPPKPPRLR